MSRCATRLICASIVVTVFLSFILRKGKDKIKGILKTPVVLFKLSLNYFFWYSITYLAFEHTGADLDHFLRPSSDFSLASSYITNTRVRTLCKIYIQIDLYHWAHQFPKWQGRSLKWRIDSAEYSKRFPFCQRGVE